jgi:hypothetical protein
MNTAQPQYSNQTPSLGVNFPKSNVIHFQEHTKKSRLHRGWTTMNEIEFIKGIGSHLETSHSPSSRKFTRLQKLIKYRTAMGLRAKWGSIDKLEVLAFVNSEIERESRYE